MLLSCSGEIVEREEELIQIKPSVMKQLKKAKYGVSDHSTVELCHWTKKSFKNEGTCYKHKFYGISTHRCMEFSPAGMYCENRCVYCWRPMEFYDSLTMEEEKVAAPEEIFNKLMEERRRLIVGFYGDKRYQKQKIDESMIPQHYAISLSGEPTMYPKLPELILFLNKLPQTKSIFLVTNGQEPQMIKSLKDKNALPTQLYLSTNAADFNSFMRINRPRYDDSWERWNTTLEMLQNLKTRTVLRVTLIKDHNDFDDMIPEFVKIFEKANVHFIELKSYMHIGRSRNRLERENMLHINEVRNFAEKIISKSDKYEKMDESEISRIVVLRNKHRIIEPNIPGY